MVFSQERDFSNFFISKLRNEISTGKKAAIYCPSVENSMEPVAFPLSTMTWCHHVILLSHLYCLSMDMMEGGSVDTRGTRMLKSVNVISVRSRSNVMSTLMDPDPLSSGQQFFGCVANVNLGGLLTATTAVVPTSELAVNVRVPLTSHDSTPPSRFIETR